MLGRSALFVAAVLGLLAPAQSFAQLGGDAGVSGIPRGPGSVGGLNNSINDPSGVGNAARTSAPPPPSTAVPPVPSMSGGVSGGLSSRSSPVVTRVGRPSRAVSRRALRRGSSRSAIRASDRLLDQKLRSICKGC
jgi:hypothetical protein